ncbi:sugar ABC transporter substrate-binding protein [Aquisalibacillus elongatus]|uniref:Carbohydrate ABC transporter substrate-binding protein (CUT1 family) n=1 Tax=Aquisalibacillus elongatus TaxID=485577 RepID=A0A3N5C7G4_9BACI|nr:extracellular solute-binding protein [Aquisalibacillus elongatus]RPF54295.1 carbohydrate ABC transporter substrate-binding protein (CUT1 family) [Aquisalibacillus elongatus]
MKKRLILFMALMLSLTLVLAACGPDRDSSDGESDDDQTEDTNNDDEGNESEGDSDKPEELLVWADEDKSEGIEEAVTAFEEEHGIEVKVEELEMATKQREQLRLDGPAGTGPDVITVPHDQIGQLVNEGLVAPLEVEKSVLDRYTESSLDAVTYEGEVYGLPKATETPVFFYNKEHLDEAPETFDELYEFSTDFTDGDQFGFLALWDNYYFSHGILSTYGGYVFNESDGVMDSSDVGLNNEGAIEGAQYIQKWYEEGLFPEGIIGENGGSAMEGLFNDGQVAAKMDGPWSVSSMNEEGIDFGVSPMPKLQNGEYAQTFVGIKSWNVSNYSENQEWATELISFLSNEENSKKRFEITNEIPPVKALIEDPIIADDPVAEAVAIQSQRGVPMPNIPEMSQVWEPMATALQLIAMGEQDAEPALNDAVKAIEENIQLSQEE